MKFNKFTFVYLISFLLSQTSVYATETKESAEENIGKSTLAAARDGDNIPAFYSFM